METLKKVIRILILAFLIILAASGILAAFLPPKRERFIDKEVRIEQVEKNKEDEDRK